MSFYQQSDYLVPSEVVWNGNRWKKRGGEMDGEIETKLMKWKSTVNWLTGLVDRLNNNP